VKIRGQKEFFRSSQRDSRDNKDFKDMINNKNRFKNRIFKCNESGFTE
jgi:hypothetical protein